MRYLVLVLGLLHIGFLAFAQQKSFHKGSILVSLSEGRTHTYLHTEGTTNVPMDGVGGQMQDGDRDPLTFEYGISDKIGLGFNLGTDILKVDPSKLYGFYTQSNSIKVFMSEVTADVHFHVVNTYKHDLSLFTSLGIASVDFSGNDYQNIYSLPSTEATNTAHYNYHASGWIRRTGFKYKYYFGKRMGIMLMGSVFSTNCTPEKKYLDQVGSIQTSMKGGAWELGPCFRFR